MLESLNSQLHFVKEIQSVDTTGVEPLRSIRDETLQGENEKELGMDDLKDGFAREEKVGRSGRLRTKRNLPEDTNDAEQWDPLAYTGKKVGRFFVVETGKE